MKAVQIRHFGSPDDLVIGEAPAPTAPGEGQLLVRVSAASVNPLDELTVTGRLQSLVPLDLPVTVGGDFAGIVREVGPGVDNVRVGDAVIGQAHPVLGGNGTFAEFILAPAALTSRAPAGIDLVEAAGLPLAGTSALQALRTLEVGPQSTIVVLGAGGAAGSIGVQAAKHLGATVIADAAADDRDYVRSLGADEVYDYVDTSWVSRVHNVDGILDASTGVDATVYYPMLRPAARYVSLATRHDLAAATAAGVEAISQFTYPATDLLAEVATLVDAGVIHQRIVAVFPAVHARAAFAAAGIAHGKCLVTF
ncbi:NADP-dependent oxidoreductase [Cryobacterium sp. MLB-32]|uniref:NADP-dependent oxidoreductase n=1 Tax=Cryobacterium sp. MLB-32 TaxID=1529318 RepID=UPI00068F729B|nr:NADP-dependent oxidoreductase [Cryobacterium sp. MLB-32]